VFEGNGCPTTATNDLATAVASGLLRAVGQRRGRRYLPGEELHISVAGALHIGIDTADSAKDRIIGELSRRLGLDPVS